MSAVAAAPPAFSPRPFVPARWLRNGHAMTVAAWARARRFPALPPPQPRLFPVAPDSQVLAHCYWQPERASRPLLLALHGLEGSHEAHYMRGLADQAWRRGWSAVLLNQRNCGRTEHLTPGLYHSGLTDDPRAVIRELARVDRVTRVGVVGYSLGGNLTVKLAGELHASPDLPVRACAAVSPTIDLDRCVHAIERPANIPYHFNFVRNLRARMRRKDAAWPRAFDLARLGRIWTIRAFDEAYTAPHHGFGSASDYYHRASALRVASRISVPTLILAAADDPFVPAEQFDDPDLRQNPLVVVHIARHGGHCGFIGGNDDYWAEETAVAFLGSYL